MTIIDINVCPYCNTIILPTKHNEYYFMCYICIRGWTHEELLGIAKYKLILKEREQ